MKQKILTLPRCPHCNKELTEWASPNIKHIRACPSNPKNKERPTGAAKNFGRRSEPLEDGVPCKHPGCLHHVSHPCEGCGRIAGVDRRKRELMKSGQELANTTGLPQYLVLLASGDWCVLGKGTLGTHTPIETFIPSSHPSRS